ncbi:MFS transporter [Rhodococcus sp. OK302]|uniref:MFS transporter n=1 Tax=Rhodococcus sp. OK302 TaxID=1882769 RepID=UPI000B93AAAB|nr:MFS transporter [Rhodococcus sp. OK302]OYD68206.1 putative MFS family arabinose efflux permease [Rhodococcus sp. OK302]
MTDANTASAPRASVPLRLSLALGSGTILQPLNSSMIAVAIVPIAIHFGSSSGTAWVISALYIATAVAAPTAGRLGSILGAKRTYLAGLGLIAAGAILGSLAPSLGWLIAARILLGIGTATQYPNAMTVVRRYADQHKAQTRSAVATLTICAQSVVALGPTLGGLLVGTLGWQSIMWINLPLVVVTGLWVSFATPADPPRPNKSSTTAFVRSLDPLGITLFLVLVTTTMLFLLSLSDGPSWYLLPAIAVSGILFTLWERRTDAPFIDVRAVAANHALSMTLGRALLTYTAFYCIFFGLPQWLQVGRGMSPTTAGLFMLPIAAVGIVSTMAASRTYGLYGARITLLIGTAALAVGGLLVAFVESSSTPLVVLLVVAAILGIPNGFNNMGNQNLVNSVTTSADVGMAIGLYRTIQYIGANLAAVVIELTMRGTIDDAGLHRTGGVITIIGITLLVGVVFSRSLRSG